MLKSMGDHSSPLLGIGFFHGPCLHFAQLDHDVGAGLVPALRPGTDEGLATARSPDGHVANSLAMRMVLV